MKTTKTIVVMALSSIALASGAAFADKYPSNPERDYVDQTLPSISSGAGVKVAFDGDSGDGWKDVGGERGIMFVGGVKMPGSDAHEYTAEELMQARLDYRNAN